MFLIGNLIISGNVDGFILKLIAGRQKFVYHLIIFIFNTTTSNISLLSLVQQLAI